VFNEKARKLKTFIVDSFTDKPFRGNPAGVCILDHPLTDAIMLSIAQELNLSETAFIASKNTDSQFTIRYFSPKKEIPLCGHATLAAARVVFANFGYQEAHFLTAANIDLATEMSIDGLAMRFPVYETQPADVPPDLIAALSIDSVVNARYNVETKILLLEIADTQRLANLNPDFPALYASHDAINGVLVTAPSPTDEYDFYSRYFWPWSGTNEDPVTGATHTFLAKYWGQKLGKTKMRSYQASKRSGSMEVELMDERLVIRSQAVIVLEGTMFLQ
jgi:PhzF family phenazine biosynthesis protein